MISRRWYSGFAGFAGAALLCTAAACAQVTSAQPNGQMGTKGGTGTQSAMDPNYAADAAQQASATDKRFLKEATEGNTAEIDLGKLAQEKSNSPDVKKFGERMVQDHTKLNDETQPLAQQIGITVSPDQISPKDQALQAKIQGLSGDQFDKAYIEAMVKDHTQDVSKFRHEIATRLARAHNVPVGGSAQTSSGK